MDYGKITTESTIQRMPNPYHLTISNPDEEWKRTIAELDGWLEMEYTEQPPYNPETEYLVESWVEEEGKAKQAWTVEELPEPEAEIEDYQEALNDLGVDTDEEEQTEE